MYARIPALCVMFFCISIPLDLRAEDNKDPIKRSIRVQVLLVESDTDLSEDERRQLSGPSERVLDAIKKLSDQGKTTLVNDAEMTVMEEVKAMLQVGATVSVQTGSVRTGAGRESRVYQDVSIGTVIQLMTKVVGDHVLVELDFSKSDVTPRSDDDPELPQGTSQLTHQTALQIKDGNAQLVGRMMSRESGDKKQALQLIVLAEILDAATPVQITKFRTSSQQSTRGDASRSRTDGRSTTRPSSRVIPEELRRRFATAMFDRADENKDGVISDSELSRLNPRDSKMKPPIKKDQYVNWMASREIPSRGSRVPPDALRRPSLPRPPSPKARPEARETTDEKREAAKADAKKDEGDEAVEKKSRIGDTQIEIVPELGTIILRGSKRDVQRAIGVIKDLEGSEPEADAKDEKQDGDSK